jgi:predicted permease
VVGRRRKALDTLERDIADHLAREVQEQVERGLSPDAARRAALKAFGPTITAAENARAVWVPVWIDQARQDSRYGLRMLMRNPGLTLAAIITLALGIGANTAVFSLIEAIVVQRLPVRSPEQLVMFTDNVVGEGTHTSTSPPEGSWHLYSYEAFQYLQQQPLPFEAIAATRSGQSTALLRLQGGSGAPERAQVHLVSGNYFEVMGTAAAIGRTFSAGDDRPDAAPAVVISDRFWRERLGGSQSAPGTTLTLNGAPFTIAGVAAPEFFGERVRRPPDMWVPLTFQPAIEQRESRLPLGNVYWLMLVGRLSAGTTPAAAERATTAALHRFVADRTGAVPSPERRRSIESIRAVITDGASGLSSLRRRFAEPLQLVLLVVGLLMLLACANVGNLLLARATVRRREFFVRLALGAGRVRIVRQLFVESLLLAALGGAAGLLLAYWSLDLLLALMISEGSPVVASLNTRILGFTALVTIGAALLFGLAPATFAWRQELIAALKARGSDFCARRRSGLFAEPLVIAQLAICLVLLVAAGLLTRSLSALSHEAFGFDAAGVTLIRIHPRTVGYTPANVAALYRRLIERLQTEPGVSAVTLTRYSPFSGGRSRNSGRIEGYTPGPSESMDLETQLVGPSYPQALGIAVRAGRAIGPEDVAGRQVGMVNEAFVRKYLPGQSAIGRRFSISGSQPGDPEPNIEIVGVLADAQFHDAREPLVPVVFLPEREEYRQFTLDAEIAIRSDAGHLPTAEQLRKAIQSVDPNLPMDAPRLLRDQVTDTFAIERLATRLIGGFSTLALLLACVGLYGVAVQRANRRTTEIGIRLALGAQPSQIVAMLLRDAVRPAAIGLLAGLPLAWAAAQLLRSLLYRIPPTDLVSFTTAIAGVVFVAALAGTLPAHRAARVDPLVTLKTE